MSVLSSFENIFKYLPNINKKFNDRYTVWPLLLTILIKYELIILIWPKFKLQRSFGEYSYKIALVIERFQLILLVTTRVCCCKNSRLRSWREFNSRHKNYQEFLNTRTIIPDNLLPVVKNMCFLFKKYAKK
jgi:hypothetical protein